MAGQIERYVNITVALSKLLRKETDRSVWELVLGIIRGRADSTEHKTQLRDRIIGFVTVQIWDCY